MATGSIYNPETFGRFAQPIFGAIRMSTEATMLTRNDRLKQAVSIWQEVLAESAAMGANRSEENHQQLAAACSSRIMAVYGLPQTPKRESVAMSKEVLHIYTSALQV